MSSLEHCFFCEGRKCFTKQQKSKITLPSLKILRINYKNCKTKSAGNEVFARFLKSIINKSSHPEVFCKNSAHKNFAKFTGKHLRHSLFFNKVAGLKPATLLKKSLWHNCFPVDFAKFLRTPPVAASETRTYSIAIFSLSITRRTPH